MIGPKTCTKSGAGTDPTSGASSLSGTPVPEFVRTCHPARAPETSYRNREHAGDRSLQILAPGFQRMDKGSEGSSPIPRPSDRRPVTALPLHRKGATAWTQLLYPRGGQDPHRCPLHTRPDGHACSYPLTATKLRDPQIPVMSRTGWLDTLSPPCPV